MSKMNGFHMNGAVMNGTTMNGTMMNGTTMNGPMKKSKVVNGTMNGAMNGTMNGAMNGTMNGVANGYSTNGVCDDHPNNNSSDKRESFLRNLFEILLKEGVNKGTDIKGKVLEFRHPHQLKKLVDLELKEDGDDNETLLDLCQQTIKYSVKTGHPHFHNQLFGGRDYHGMAGSWLTDTMNTSQYTYEVGPVFTLMEQVVFRRMCELVGFPNGDGIFCPGGSVSNMYAINLARYHKFPQIKKEGMQALPKICAFTSEESHYSVTKGVAFLGIGVNNLRLVPCDDFGRMIPEELDRMVVEAKQQGYTPFYVNATGGSTVSGAYDPVQVIADICERHDMWLHLDACWGGGAFLSRKHRHMLSGSDRCDSVAWNPHKMMGAPLQCCAFLTKHKTLLEQAHSAKAQYLFQQDKFYDVSYDTGDKSIQCGRKVDVFKLWLMWRARGHRGFEEGVDRAFDNAKYLHSQLQQTEGFRVTVPEIFCTNVGFWYIPPSMRGQEETEEWWQKISKVAPKIKERMMLDGSMLIGYQPLGKRVNFFRMVVTSLDLNHKHMDEIIENIERLGNDL